MKSQLRTIVGCLALLLVFPSCATYKESVSLQEAFNSQQKVQITTVNRKQIEYQKIDTLKGKWVGEKILSNNQKLYEPIDPKSISSVKLHRSMQAERTEGLTVLGIILLPALVIAAIALAI